MNVGDMRVMIVSANGYGRGHEALADALVEELGVTVPAASVVVVDGMEESFGSLNRRGRDSYARRIARDPEKQALEDTPKGACFLLTLPAEAA